MPKVSVCIPAYNGRAYLEDALESVLRQSFVDWELVICDDASTDDTSDICRSIPDSRVRYLRFAQNGGQAVNWNRCIDAAQGQYVVLLHQDDMLGPTYLERAVEVLDTCPKVALVHCAVQHIGAQGDPIRAQRLYGEDRIESGEVLFRQLVLRGCIVNPAGVMVRRQAYEAVGPFAAEIAWGIDWHMWIRIALRFDVAYLADDLARYRDHPQSGTAAVVAAARNGSDELWVIDEIFKAIRETRPDLYGMHGVSVRQVAHRTWCWAERMCQQGFERAARAGIRRAVEIWPGMLLEGRIWGLLAATYLGYSWFCRMQRIRASLPFRMRLKALGGERLKN
jgi:glycosyltransferase involved in cell wall biosynthesis